MTSALDELWSEPSPSPRVFDPAGLAGLPAPAARYLRHALRPGAPLASAVRLTMHGEIKLRRWRRFTAEQVLRPSRGMVWQARTTLGPFSVRGYDRVLDGAGAMRWKLLGLLPVMSATGPDITRSAIGRLQIETIWLPSLHAEGADWEGAGEAEAMLTLESWGQEGRLRLKVDERGALEAVSMKRWGDPDGSGEFRELDFGAIIEGEASFAGATIPSRLRVGWGDDFERGEFFRVTIDAVEFR